MCVPMGPMVPSFALNPRRDAAMSRKAFRRVPTPYPPRHLIIPDRVPSEYRRKGAPPAAGRVVALFQLLRTTVVYIMREEKSQTRRK